MKIFSFRTIVEWRTGKFFVLIFSLKLHIHTHKSKKNSRIFIIHVERCAKWRIVFEKSVKRSTRWRLVGEFSDFKWKFLTQISENWNFLFFLYCNDRSKNFWYSKMIYELDYYPYRSYYYSRPRYYSSYVVGICVLFVVFVESV